MKKISIVLVVMMMFGGVAFADAASGTVTDAGNKICPISGGAVSGSAFVEHQGVRYGICCAACAKKFQADPEKYLAKLAEKEGKSGVAGAMESAAEHVM